MKNHILIINTPKHDAERYLDLLISQICSTPELTDTPIQILTPDFPNGLPVSLRSQGVVHHTGDASEDGMLLSAGADKAEFIIVLCPDTNNIHCDSLTFDILHRIQMLHTDAFVMAEAINDTNRVRFKQAGAKAVIRPVRAYPEMLVRSLIAPGSEQVLENLFSHQGDHTVRVELALRDFTWAHIVTVLIQNNIGTALGYEDKHGEIITHPPASEHVETQSLMILVDDKAEAIEPSEVLALFTS